MSKETHENTRAQVANVLMKTSIPFSKLQAAGKELELLFMKVVHGAKKAKSLRDVSLGRIKNAE